MFINHVKQLLKDGKQVFGLFCSIPNPLIVEMIGHAGYDFIIIDTEHASINPETVENMIRAAEAAGLTPFVRVSENSEGAILRALDAGAKGVVVPHIRTKEEAERAVRSSRYFPLGMRSLNGGRPARFGKESLTSYIQQANKEVMVIFMIEDEEGLKNLPDILSVPGVDMVLEGAADLSQSLGMPWQTRSSIVKKEIEKIFHISIEKQIPFCAIPRAHEDFVQWLNLGVQAFVVGDDRGIFFRTLRENLEFKKEYRKGSQSE
jgi:staphyloferrin B biosynthesis citrate synthase